ncbi:MAG: PD-(D/E)XK nuclease family protein, partial [Oscillospiraceae bacterium]|nr:PD-(D/E)XK nuclease family protein [Candidatus Equicaccousia limihippi]
MSVNFGGIEYDENQYLNPKGTFCDNTLEPNIEICYTFEAGKNQYETEALRAYYKIKELIESDFFVTDNSKDNDKVLSRKIKYSDIAEIARDNLVLLQYKHLFDKMGIPVSYNNEDLSSSSEIKLLISLLKIIVNPHDGISLTSVLLSPIYSFTASDMLIIKSSGNYKSSLFSKILSVVNENPKFSKFITDYREIKEFSSVNSVGDTISFILDKFSLADIAATFDNGDVRKKNIMLFENAAHEFSDENENIAAFIRYCENSLDLSLKGSSVNDNTVKLMTMHSSKGLQFPICIIAGCAKQLFNSGGLSLENYFIVNEKQGVGLKLRDYDKNFIYKTTGFDGISKQNRTDDLSDNLRLFYVVATRACEKLIFMITSKKTLEKEFENAVKCNFSNGKCCDSQFVKQFSDLLNIYAIHNGDSPEIRSLASPGMSEPFGEVSVKIDTMYAEDLTVPEQEINTNRELQPDDKLLKRVNNVLAFNYKYGEVYKIESKMSVSALVKQNGDDYDFTARPLFAQKGKLSPSQKGTALHKFMQFADYNKALNDLSGEIDRIYEMGWISLDEKESLETDKIENFLQSNIFNRILASNNVMREKRFLIELPAGQINSELSPPISEEKVVVQGAIDCLFEEDGKLVIVDFKTDRTDDESVLKARY